MVDVPWFMLSPSPFSLAQYALMTFIGYRFLIKHVTYQRFPKLLAFTDSLLLMGLLVVSSDAVWCVFCASRWLSSFPQDAFQIFSSLGRDVVGSVFLFLFVGGYFQNHILTFSSQTKLALIANVAMMGLWFALAPSIAYTDYTYAYRNGFPASFVFFDFLLSHVLMRVPLWLAWFGIFRLKDRK